MQHFSNDHKDHPNQHKNSHKLCETGHPVLSLLESQWKVNNIIKTLQFREIHCRTNTSIRKKKEIQKTRTLRVTVKDPSRKFISLSKVIWDRRIMTEFTRSASSNRIGWLIHQVYQFQHNRLASPYNGH